VLNSRFASSLIAVLLAPGSIDAQSARPGLALDQVITVVNEQPTRVDSSTNYLHMIFSGADSRIEMRQNTLYPTMGPFNPGPHAVLVTKDGGRTTVFLNPDTKEYFSMKPLEMMDGFKKMLESMGGSMVVDTSATTAALDSLGPGPKIDGHPTLRYRLTTATRMTISMMGESTVSSTRSTMDMDVATDMGDYQDALAATMSGIADVTRSMGFAKGFSDKLAEQQRRVHGLPLRVVRNATVAQGTTIHASTTTIDSRNVQRVTVPDSLFAIPAGYKQVLLPTMPGVN
jgi:hypothetical protein